MVYRNFILVCAGTGCHSNMGQEIYEALLDERRDSLLVAICEINKKIGKESKILTPRKQ